jgi:hypothetical protein
MEGSRSLRNFLLNPSIVPSQILQYCIHIGPVWTPNLDENTMNSSLLPVVNLEPILSHKGLIAPVEILIEHYSLQIAE